MQPNKHEKKEKHILAVDRELTELYKVKWHGAKWIPCKPYQHGWIREYVLRDDVARSVEAPDMKRILKAICHKQWCKEKSFEVPKSRRKCDKKHLVPMDPPPIEPIQVRPHPTYPQQELGWSLPESYKKWFIRHAANAPYCQCYKKGQYYRPAHYVFRFPWKFELRVVPAFITKTLDVDGDTQSMIDQLTAHMYNYNGYPLLAHLKGYSYDKMYDRCCLINPPQVERKKVKQELRDKLDDLDED